MEMELSHDHDREMKTKPAQKNIAEESILKQLCEDPTKVKFFQDLLSSKLNFGNNVKQTSTLSSDLEGPEKFIPSQANENQNILKLIKSAIRGKYGEHVRKSIKDRDFAALQCLLALQIPEEDIIAAGQNLIQNPQQSGDSGSKSHSEPDVKKSNDKITQNTTMAEVTELAKHRKEIYPNRSSVSVPVVAANVFRTMTYELLKQQLRASYERILQFSNPNLIQVEHSESAKKVESNTISSTHQDQLNPQAFQSALICAIKSFRKYCKAMIELTADEELELFETSSKNALRMKHYWIQEMFYLRAVNTILAEGRELEKNKIQSLSRLDNEIKVLQEQIEFAKLENIEMVREEIKQGEMERLVDEKIASKSSCQIDDDSARTMAARIEVMLQQCRNENEMRQRKLELETKLEKIIEAYDCKLTSGQMNLDNFDLEINENEILLSNLRKRFDEIDVKYEDMMRTQKLKELLKRIEMADSFKRNRAARIIQLVWRRYKLNKYKKMKKKLRLRRRTGGKKDSGVDKKQQDSSSEAGKGSTRSGSTVPNFPVKSGSRARSTSTTRSSIVVSSIVTSTNKSTEKPKQTKVKK